MIRPADGKALRHLGPGDIFGENCCIDPNLSCSIRLHSITALEPLEICKLYLDDLELLVANHVDFVLTSQISSWRTARNEIIGRYRSRMGTITQSEVLDRVQSLKNDLRVLKYTCAALSDSAFKTADGSEALVQEGLGKMRKEDGEERSATNESTLEPVEQQSVGEEKDGDR